MGKLVRWQVPAMYGILKNRTYGDRDSVAHTGAGDAVARGSRVTLRSRTLEH